MHKIEVSDVLLKIPLHALATDFFDADGTIVSSASQLELVQAPQPSDLV